MILKDSQYKEVMKLYPHIRIPYMNEAMYYILELAKGGMIGKEFEDFTNCHEMHGDVTSYKMKKFDEILAYFKESLLDNFNNHPLPSSEDMISQYPKSFGNWKTDCVYVSIDMNAANWSVFNSISGLKTNKSWPEFAKETFDLHPFLADSKSFRQFIFGNLNPGRQQSHQKAFMIDLASLMSIYDMPRPVMLSADEILYEIPVGESWFTPQFSDLKYAVKETTYCMEIEESYGERILVKRNLKTDKKKLFSIQGTRYFIHYKNVILNQPVEERDLYFEPEPKRLAKWIL